MALVYLNGEWLAAEDAKVSVFDRGFMFGDGVYENIALYGRQIFLLEQHVDRLLRSLEAIRLHHNFTADGLRRLLQDAAPYAETDFAFLYVQITRGIQMPRTHVHAGEIEPTVMMTLSPGEILRRDNIRAYRLAVKEDIRWSRGDIKAISLIGAGLLKNEAIREGFDDAVLVREGYVTEATSANLFALVDGVVVTPPKNHFLLPGITRDHILDLCRKSGIAVSERPLTVHELKAAEEVWISSTGHEAWPVAEIDDHVISKGGTGPMWRKIDGLFQASKPRQSP